MGVTDRALLGTGMIGAVIVALCCFTPVLVVLAGVVGAATIVGYFDYVLLPALVFFVGLTIYAVQRRQSRERTASQSTRSD
jgi:mercuric ion transport protein